MGNSDEFATDIRNKPIIYQAEVDALVRELRSFKFQREDAHLLTMTPKRTYFKESFYTKNYRKFDTQVI